VCFGGSIEGEPLLNALLLSRLILGVEGVLQNETSEPARVGVLFGRSQLLAQGEQEGRLNGWGGLSKRTITWSRRKMLSYQILLLSSRELLFGLSTNIANWRTAKIQGQRELKLASK
jgi:hypothetical protein